MRAGYVLYSALVCAVLFGNQFGECVCMYMYVITSIDSRRTDAYYRKLSYTCAGINMIFPFLPFMIHDFFPYLDKTELGKSIGRK